MNTNDAIARMQQKSANLQIERARLDGVLRTIRDMAGIDVARSMTASALERLGPNANDNSNWIG
jgi:hypothetical protein